MTTTDIDYSTLATAVKNDVKPLVAQLTASATIASTSPTAPTTTTTDVLELKPPIHPPAPVDATGVQVPIANAVTAAPGPLDAMSSMYGWHNPYQGYLAPTDDKGAINPYPGIPAAYPFGTDQTAPDLSFYQAGPVQPVRVLQQVNLELEECFAEEDNVCARIIRAFDASRRPNSRPSRAASSFGHRARDLEKSLM